MLVLMIFIKNTNNKQRKQNYKQLTKLTINKQFKTLTI